LSFRAGMSKVTGDIHPSDSYLRVDAIPSVWCSGCGIGLVVHTFIQTLKYLRFDLNKLCVVSGLGCTGKIAEYLNLPSFITTNSNLFEYAGQLKSKNAGSKIIVFSNNADFLVSGAKDFIEIGKKNIDLTVIHINNIIYTITENGIFPNTPFRRMVTGQSDELPFNIPHLAKSCGAQYVARWTPLRAGWLMYSIIDTILKGNFSVIEVVSPCVTYYANRDQMGDAVERMAFYDHFAIMKPGESTENLDLRAHDRLIIGKFLDKDEI